MLHESNTSYTSFIPDPEEKLRQLALGMAVRSRASDEELLVDNFAGGGGASKGIELAFGRSVDIAINHDGEALVMHTANHPGTAHYQEDVFDVHPGFITGQRPIGLAWFSPDCKHHSKAKGGKPRDQKIRGLAWVALKWGALQKPRCIAIENVTELTTWGPLDAHGKPIKKEAGRTFRAFIDALSHGLDPSHPDIPEIYDALGADFPMERLYEGLGYAVEYRVLRASDYGVPTTRTRLFIFARRDGLPIEWPAPTHGDPKAKGFAVSGLLPWRTAAECIDFDLPAQSIFGRARPLATNTERRVAKGLWRHVLASVKPYIVGAHSGKPVPVAEPMGTVSTENDRQLVQPAQTPYLTEHANGSNQRTMSATEPLRTICAQVKGGHFSVVTPKMAPLVMTNTTGHPGASVEQPLPTITTGGHHAIVAPMIAPLRGTSEGHFGGHPFEAPLSTVSAGGTHHALTSAHLVTIGYGERKGQEARAQDIEGPLGTVVAANKHALVAAHLTKFRTGNTGQAMDEPMPTVTANSFVKRPGGAAPLGIVAAHLTHLTHNGERSGHEADKPLPTVTGANRGEQALVAAYLEQANGGFYNGEGRPADAPMTTITSTGAQQQLVTAYCVKYYSSGGQWQGLDDPMHTIPTKARMGLVDTIKVPANFLSEAHALKAKMCADLLHKHLPEHFPEPAEMVLVFLQGQWWVLLDITLRMLTPRELARAQGFPDDYVIEPMVRRYKRVKPHAKGRSGKNARAHKEWVLVPLSKSAQVRMIGNSVCPRLARLLIEANFPAIARLSQAA